MITDALRKAIARAIYAPSGENCQPWRFEVHADHIRVYNVPERDLSMYNFRQLGSYVAHGALVENLTLTLSEAGYEARVEPFPDPQDPERTANVYFSQSWSPKNPLAGVILERSTNRKPYLRQPFAPSERAVLEACAIGRGATLTFLEDQIKREVVAEAMTAGDRLLFEHRGIHDFLFSHINWTLGKERALRRGFYVKTLELPLPVEGVFRIVRYWPILSLLNLFGFARLAAKGNRKLYLASSAFGAILTAGNSPQDYFEAGRVLQKGWLTATTLGLSIQPITAIPFFMQRVAANESGFSPAQEALIKKAYGAIAGAFGAGDRTIAILFRIGCAPTPPTAVSLKAEPEIREVL